MANDMSAARAARARKAAEKVEAALDREDEREAQLLPYVSVFERESLTYIRKELRSKTRNRELYPVDMIEQARDEILRRAERKRPND